MPLQHRQRETDPETYRIREMLTVEADGVFAIVHRDRRGSWRGRVLVMWGTIAWDGTPQPAHDSDLTFSAPKAAGEGQAIAIAERTIRATLAALERERARRWWKPLPPNCPAMPASAENSEAR